jgi:hypothetical protein
MAVTEMPGRPLPHRPRTRTRCRHPPALPSISPFPSKAVKRGRPRRNAVPGGNEWPWRKRAGPSRTAQVPRTAHDAAVVTPPFKPCSW